jgi:hypothetical protein
LKDIFKQAIEYSEENVKLYKKYQPLGMPKLSIGEMAYAWLNYFKIIYKRLRSARNKGHFANILWLLGWRIGRIMGCFKYKVFAP